jgi:16S rRNA (guanine966-N2)-methyltransferase
MLRIIAGEYKSRSLEAPEDSSVSRPYPGRVREAVFNLLRGWFDGARVLDLFAGVGSMGLEAVSRGAAQVVLIERDKRVYNLLKRNIDALGCSDRAEAVMADAVGPMSAARAPRPLDIVFVDPPYPMMTDERRRQTVLAQIARLRVIMAVRGFIVLRSPVNPDAADFAIPGFDGPEARQYGDDMWVLLYSPAADESNMARLSP